MNQRKRWLSLLAALTIAALIAAGCGDDGDSETSPNTEAPETTSGGGADNGDGNGSGEVEGCGPEAATDPSDMSVGREVARCEPGYPAPQPLPEMTTINVSSAFRLEFNSPLLLADSLGELEKENLKMNFISLKFSDAVPQMASGDIDVAVGGIEIALFAAGNQGLPVKATLANYFPPHAGDYDVDQTGLWCRRDSFTTPEDPDLHEIADMRLASSVGAGSISFYASQSEIQRQLDDETFTLKNAQITNVPSAETVTALEGKAIDCGIVLDPLWTLIADNDDYFLAASQTPGEPLGIYAFGKRLLVDNPEIGDAFTRAFIRTVNTYFDGDYHEDAEVMAEISKQTELPMDRLTAVDSLVMDWEFREGTGIRAQQYLIDVGVITDWSTPIPEEKFIDPSFYLRAVGAE